MFYCKALNLTTLPNFNILCCSSKLPMHINDVENDEETFWGFNRYLAHRQKKNKLKL